MYLLELALFMFKFQTKQPSSSLDYLKIQMQFMHSEQDRLLMTIIFFLVTKQ